MGYHGILWASMVQSAIFAVFAPRKTFPKQAKKSKSLVFSDMKLCYDAQGRVQNGHITTHELKV